MTTFDPAEVRQAVAEFTPRRPQKFQDLVPAKEVIVELRQKRASYRAIAELLTQHCLPTSKTAIAMFCHEVLGENIRPRKRPATETPVQLRVQQMGERQPRNQRLRANPAPRQNLRQIPTAAKYRSPVRAARASPKCANSIHKPMKRLILILNGKGGVGKSFFAVNFVQFLKDKGIAHVAIDSDNENSTLKRFHPDTRFLDLSKRRDLDAIFAALGEIESGRHGLPRRIHRPVH